MKNLTDGERDILTEQERDAWEAEAEHIATYHHLDGWWAQCSCGYAIEDVYFAPKEYIEARFKEHTDEAFMADVAEAEQDAEQSSWRASGILPPFE